MKLDDIKKLHQKKYRNEFQHFIVEGEHLVLELEKAARHSKELKECQLFVSKTYKDWQGPFVSHILSDRQMAQISDTKTPQGIVAVVPFLKNINTRSQASKAIYLHEIQDPGNLGTILRTLAWFGNFTCLLSPGSVDPYNPKVVRSSMGAIFHVPVELEVDIGSLGRRFGQIACLDMAGSRISDPGFKAFDCYVFGNEARGLPKTHLAGLQATPYTITGNGAIESLNLASVVNMCIYEIKR